MAGIKNLIEVTVTELFKKLDAFYIYLIILSLPSELQNMFWSS